MVYITHVIYILFLLCIFFFYLRTYLEVYAMLVYNKIDCSLGCGIPLWLSW